MSRDPVKSSRLILYHCHDSSLSCSNISYAAEMQNLRILVVEALRHFIGRHRPHYLLCDSVAFSGG